MTSKTYETVPSFNRHMVGSRLIMEHHVILPQINITKWKKIKKLCSFQKFSNTYSLRLVGNSFYLKKVGKHKCTVDSFELYLKYSYFCVHFFFFGIIFYLFVCNLDMQKTWFEVWTRGWIYICDWIEYYDVNIKWKANND